MRKEAVLRTFYRAGLSQPGAHMILRQADVGGALMTSREFCLARGRSRIERDRGVGLRIYNDREAPP